jgi:hypothetical protein
MSAVEGIADRGRGILRLPQMTSPPSAEAGYRNGRGAWLPPDRRFTALHRRAYGPSSIYFAAASKPACDALAVRQAEQFGIGGVFRTQETPLGGRMC